MAASAEWVRWGVSLLVPLVVGIGVVVYQRSSPLTKELGYRVVSVTPVGPSQAPGFTGLRLMHGEEVIQEPHLLSLVIENAGDLDIPPSSFTGPLVIKVTAGGFLVFPGVSHPEPIKWGQKTLTRDVFQGVHVVSARLAWSRPNDMSAALTIKGDQVEIAPLLLNRQDQLGIELLVSGAQPTATVNSRIEGVGSIRDLGPVEKQDDRPQAYFFLGLTAVLLWSIAVLLAVRPPTLKVRVVTLVTFVAALLLAVFTTRAFMLKIGWIAEGAILLPLLATYALGIVLTVVAVAWLRPRGP